jgi:hypothetical protein
MWRIDEPHMADTSKANISGAVMLRKNSNNAAEVAAMVRRNHYRQITDATLHGESPSDSGVPVGTRQSLTQMS